MFAGLFATISVPNADELVATPYRHGTKKNTEAFFLSGMAEAMHNLAEDGRVYNEVVTGWSGIESAAVKIPGPKQGTLFDNEGDT